VLSGVFMSLLVDSISFGGGRHTLLHTMLSFSCCHLLMIMFMNAQLWQWFMISCTRMQVGREDSPSPSTSSSLSSTLVPNFFLYCGRESGFLATGTFSLSTGAVASLMHFDCTSEGYYQVKRDRNKD
jgi:hypothetical protein